MLAQLRLRVREHTCEKDGLRGCEIRIACVGAILIIIIIIMIIIIVKIIIVIIIIIIIIIIITVIMIIIGIIIACVVDMLMGSIWRQGMRCMLSILVYCDDLIIKCTHSHGVCAKIIESVCTHACAQSHEQVWHVCYVC